MDEDNTQYEIHVHGDVPLRHDVGADELEKALAPLLEFAEATSFSDGAESYYPDEPGLVFNKKDSMLHMCWTVQGDDSFDEVSHLLCQNLNDLAREGAPIEISYIDLDEEADSDEYQLLFIGPTLKEIIKSQRDLLVKETLDLMERHFDATELNGIIAEIDQLFEKRFDKISQSENPMKALWTGIPFTGLCDPTKRRLH